MRPRCASEWGVPPLFFVYGVEMIKEKGDTAKIALYGSCTENVRAGKAQRTGEIEGGARRAEMYAGTGCPRRDEEERSRKEFRRNSEMERGHPPSPPCFFGTALEVAEKKGVGGKAVL